VISCGFKGESVDRQRADPRNECTGELYIASVSLTSTQHHPRECHPRERHTPSANGEFQQILCTTWPSTPAAFDAATTNVTNIDFEGIAPANNFTLFGKPGNLKLSGVTFTTTATNTLADNSATYYLAQFGPPGYNLDKGGLPDIWERFPGFASCRPARRFHGAGL
jgi:hypothetical protein